MRGPVQFEQERLVLAGYEPDRLRTRRWRRQGYRAAVVMLLIVAQGCASAPPTAAPGAAAPGAAGAPGAPATPATPGAPATASAGGATVNVTTPSQPCCPHETLWEFLGFKGGFTLLAGLINRIRNRLGSIFPGLEAKPAMVAITDPSMASSSNPAEAAAAGAKADEDAAPQKIKAIRYLATLGCAGCYPGIEEALLAALDDCTEAVRYEAAKALRENSGKPCAVCKTKGCCSPKVMKKLNDVANKMVKGCYVESSARVRREARLAMAGCGNPPPPETNTDKPKEGPSEGPPAAGATADNGDGSGSNDSADAAIATLLGKPAPQTAAQTAGVVTETRTFGGSNDTSDCGCNRPGTITIQTTVPATAAKPTNVARAIKTSTAATTKQPRLAPQSTDEKGTAQPSELRIASPAPISVLRTSGAVLAEVNGQLVFESEVLPQVDRQLAVDGPELTVEQKLRQRPAYIRRELARVIDRKLIYQDARRNGPEVAQAAFDPAEQDEQSVADAWLSTRLKIDKTVTREQLQACYAATKQKYPQEPAVRYEQVVAPLDKFATDEDARFAIEYARNRALGIPQAPAAAARLQGLQASTADWTKKDGVDSPALAQALFTMPVGSISAVFSAADGLHVYRVLERHNAGSAPLEAVADKVKADVLSSRRAYMEQAYVTELRAKAQVWTVFDPKP